MGLGGVAPAIAAEGELCPNEAFRTGLSASLPDCRAYEQVTPPYKEGARVELKAVSLDGSRAIVQSLGNFGDDHTNPETEGATYELTRGPTGWSEMSVEASASQFFYIEFLDASLETGETLWNMRAASQPLDASDLYVRAADGSLHDLGPVAPPAATTLPPGRGFRAESPSSSFFYRGASNDLSHVLFTIGNPSFDPSFLWPGDSTEAGGSLYEYTTTRSGGPPALVGLDNSGALVSQCGVIPGATRYFHPAPHGISAGGSTVFFTALGALGGEPCSGSEPAVNELYARIGSPDETQATVNVAGTSGCAASASCNVTSAPTYQGASDSGSEVFFTAEQAGLVMGDADATNVLYECDLPGDGGAVPAPTGVVNPCPSLHPVSVGTASGAKVLSVRAISEDGSHVYFTAAGVLTGAEENQNHEKATEGANNLYVYERDGAFPSGHTSFIGKLSSSEPPAQTTPEGRFLVFSDAADLTPDDSSTDQQVFEYDAEPTGGPPNLVRVSIGEGGFNADGNTNNPAVAPVIPSLSSETATVGRNPGALSSDGAYVVFTSADGLTPQALNDLLIARRCVIPEPFCANGGFTGHETEEELIQNNLLQIHYAMNVYEYHEGHVYLISDGRDATVTFPESSSVSLEGVTDQGGDVFFKTADRLVPQDTDTQQDIYDARVDGGFPVPVVSTPCQEACQGSPGSPPPFGAPASSTLSGVGNLAPTTAAAVKAKPLTGAQKLAKALEACKKHKAKKKRSACEIQARKKFGAKNAKKSSRDRSARR